ncbi:MAG: cupin domain-containing protein [Woeseiaceae bacterium]|jgi:anti-sigma factor ChrR (cupin superfamily)
MSNEINADLSIRAVAHTEQMPWTQSPSGTVWRKRVHLVGPPESGQVTSIVRYEPEATFPQHDHPDGEEILVIDGVFSDEHGDWPAGTYLLNPEGFRHAPFSREGCLLFVKLRQFAGLDRHHVTIDSKAIEWQAGSIAGVATKSLYKQSGYSDEVALERWDPGAELGVIAYESGAELFVVEGEFSDEEGSFTQGSWLRMPAGSIHHPHSANGCTLYVKIAGLPYLSSSSR